MIKTAKVKKKLRLDELIKYVIDKGLNSFQFTSDNNVDVYFYSNGYFLIAGDGSGDGGSRSFELADTFTVEVEITEESLFGSFVVITENGTIKTFNNTYNMREIRDLLENYENEQKIYALIGNNLELVWEAE